MEILADGILKLFVDVLCSADEAYRCHAESTFRHHCCGSIDQSRVIGESEIVIGAEIQYLFSGYLDGG